MGLMTVLMVLVAGQAVAPALDGGAVVLHPIFEQLYTCTEHWDGQFAHPGDALGTDCHIQELQELDGRRWLRSHRGSGHANEDWFGWHRNVLAPADGEVVKINVNPVTNAPGKMGEGMASFVVVKRADGVMVLLAHVDDIKVKVGQAVKAGQVVGVVGNNGQSRHPHVHVGAWKEKAALQIRFDQKAMGRLRKRDVK